MNREAREEYEKNREQMNQFVEADKQRFGNNKVCAEGTLLIETSGMSAEDTGALILFLKKAFLEKVGCTPDSPGLVSMWGIQSEDGD